jgi:transcription elongation factor Elf1
MKIKEIIGQSRRDFRAIYECEHCGHAEQGSGYDDANFHQNVIPDMKCKKCGKKSGDDYRPLATKYPEGFQI